MRGDFQSLVLLPYKEPIIKEPIHWVITRDVHRSQRMGQTTKMRSVIRGREKRKRKLVRDGYLMKSVPILS